MGYACSIYGKQGLYYEIGVVHGSESLNFELLVLNAVYSCKCLIAFCTKLLTSSSGKK
jgi:hypothetical protein